MTTIRNPILPGFHPDPSICRVGDDYYIATSTFEWFPGVAIHHSRDLVHWRLLDHGLKERRHIDLAGVIDSGGVWAPQLSHADGRFWLIYSNVRTRTGPFKDVHNYLITADSIHGPWSDPVYLNASGFDPALFHDDDDRKWLVNLQWDFRKDKPSFAGIVLQEYDVARQRLVGPVHTILKRDEVLTEGPNLYKRHGYYYLLLAEGGTGWNHGIALARSRRIEGPYELPPRPTLMTTRDTPGHPLQKAGHGELVQTAADEWYMVHLCSRPVGEPPRCILGRETAIQQVAWSDDGWLHLAQGGTLPALDVPAPQEIARHPWPATPARDDFDQPVLPPHWYALRSPIEPSWASLTDRPGWLRLRGRASLHALFDQSLIARPLTSVNATIETCMQFQPTHFSQMAGLICWYDTRTHYYLRVTHDETRGRVLGIILTDDGQYDELTDSTVDIGSWDRIHLQARFNETRLQFHASPDGETWQSVGPPLDATKLSDDYGQGLHFTGAMVGLCAQDLNGTAKTADFNYFTLTP